MTSGYYKRDKPELQILKGAHGFDTPEVIGDNVPVKADVVIKSGQVCYRKWNSSLMRHELVLGCVAGATPFFALFDSDSGEAAAAGSLNVISAAQPRIIQVAYYAAGTYTVGLPLTYILEGVSGAGSLTLATLDSQVIVGYVERELRATNVGAASTHAVGTRDHQAAGDYDGFTSGNMLTLSTTWTGATFHATGSGE